MTVNGMRDGEVTALFEGKIDDLAKLNIVNFLCNNPTRAASARFFAWKLGFCSIERTRAALDELAGCGILKKRQRHFDREYVYSLPRDVEVKEQLERLCDVATRSSDREEILSQLAAQSVVRAAIDAGVVGP